MGLTRPKYNNLDTSKFKIGDPITEINGNVSTTDPNNSDIGFILNRGLTGDNLAILWDKSAQEFILATTAADGDVTGDIAINSYANLHIATLRSNNMVYPIIDGAADEVLTTNGSGVLSFKSVSNSAAAWGDLTGTLSDQTDLQNALNLKVNKTGDTMTGPLTIESLAPGIVLNETTDTFGSFILVADGNTFSIRYPDTGTTPYPFLMNTLNGAVTDVEILGGKVWTNVNDGVGSGLDADLLDGLDSSIFAKVADLPDPTGPIDGGTY